MIHSSWIEINKTALRKNIRYLQKRLGNGVKFASVIKGNAYGHGIKEFVPLAEENGIDFFVVFDTNEALRAEAVKKPDTQLLIMGMINDEELGWVIEKGISFFVFDLDRLQKAAMLARQQKTRARIHLELETGLHRTGIEEAELDAALAIMRSNSRYLELEGVCTHLAGAESITNYMRIQEQMRVFEKLTGILKKRRFSPKYRHIACSAAALIYPQSIMDMARIGIAQYGYWPSMETKMNNLLSDENKFTRDPLQRILSWKSRVMSIKKVPAGSFVSYGNSFMTTKETKIATIPIGYFHGYRRSLSNTGHVLIHGSKANVIGAVNMNVFQVNVSHIPGVQKGDEVVIIGTQGKSSITVAGFSELSNQVNYEFLTRLPETIPRIVKENKQEINGVQL
ncbi:MAG: alanine racemase [Candidatus Cloacimonetes bacterium]|nr:alanine racemase [Candidatus Cloacimonadota bacterium]